MVTSEPAANGFDSTWQFSGDAFNFRQQDVPQRATRGWDRAPRSPFKSHPKGRKVWKRYNLRTRSNAEPAVNVDGREEDETLEEAEDEDGAPKRAVKRRCLDGAQEEEVEGGGVGKTGNFVGTLWEKGVEFLKRKLARRTSDEKSDPRIDLNEVGASPLHAEVDGHLDPPLGGAPLDEASDQDLPRARELSSEPQQLPKPPSPKRSPRVSRHANGTDSTQERDPESNLLSRGLLEGSFPSQPLLGSPEFSGSDETSIDTSDSVDTHIVENVAPAVKHELLTQEIHHVREEVITHEIHHHDVYHHVQPVIEIEVLSPKHFLQADDGRLVETLTEDLPGHQGNWEVLDTTAELSSNVKDARTNPELQDSASQDGNYDVNTALDSSTVEIGMGPSGQVGPQFSDNISTNASDYEFEQTDRLNSTLNSAQSIRTEEQSLLGDEISQHHHLTVEPALIADDIARYDETSECQPESSTSEFISLQEKASSIEVFSEANAEEVKIWQLEEGAGSLNNAVNLPPHEVVHSTGPLNPHNENSISITPSTPPPTDTPNPAEERPYTTRLSDTTMLKDFLFRAKARKEATAKLTSTTSPIPKPQSSPPKSPRKVLADLNPNPPSPKKNRDISERPGTPPPAPEKAESLDLKEGTTSCRRSTRTRAPATPVQKTVVPVVGAPSFIPVRRADGAEPVVLQKSEAQELAVLTKNNTRRNKGAAKLPKITIEAIVQAKQLAEDELGGAGEVLVNKKGRKRKIVGGGEGKVVSWDEQLVYFREVDEDEVEDVPPPPPTSTGGAKRIKSRVVAGEDGSKRVGSRIATPAAKKVVGVKEMHGSEMKERKTKIGTPAVVKKRKLMDVDAKEGGDATTTIGRQKATTRSSTPKVKRVADVLEGEGDTPNAKRRGRVRV